MPYRTTASRIDRDQALRSRIQAHWDAGADHVCIQTYTDEVARGPNLALLERLAPVNG